MAKTLQFRIHSVRCIDETGGKYAEKFGNDEMFLGGHSILHDGNTTQIPPFSVYPHFDDGDVKVFNPPRVFHSFDLSGSFPREFGVGMTLIEKDSGGKEEAVRKIADKVEAEVKKRLPAAREARLSESARMAAGNADAGALGTVLLYAIRLAAPHIIDYVKKQIMAAVNDDVFQPQHATVTLSSVNHSWSGSPTSAQKKVQFRDHEGVYELTYDWHLA
jgi:hypothetical protein